MLGGKLPSKKGRGLRRVLLGGVNTPPKGRRGAKEGASILPGRGAELLPGGKGRPPKEGGGGAEVFLRGGRD